MFKGLKDRVLRPSKTAGLEITILPDGKKLYNLIILTQKKSRLQKEIEMSFSEVGAFLEKFDKSIPLHVILSGKGILVKKVERISVHQSAVLAVLPQANPSDFYAQAINYRDYSIIAIARKDIVDNVLEIFYMSGLNVLDVSIGFATIEYVMSYLQRSENIEIPLVSYKLNCNLNSVSSFVIIEYSSQNMFPSGEYTLGGDIYKNISLLAFGGALSLYADKFDTASSIVHPTVDINREEQKYKTTFTAISTVFFIGIFILLLISYVGYNYYFERNKEVEASIIVNNISSTNNTELINEKDNKESFIQQMGWLYPAKSSYFADRIANEVPATIVLNSLEIYPLKNDQQSSPNCNLFMNDTIEISGYSDNPELVGKFVKGISKLEGIKETRLKRFSQEPSKEKSQFFIEVVTKQ